MGIGPRIKQAREAKKMTQSELATKIGVTPSAVANYEKETSHPKEAVLYAMFDALDVDANFLFQDVMNRIAVDLDIEEKNLIDSYRQLDAFDKESLRLIVDRMLAREKRE